MTDYTDPVILRIWGGTSACLQEELLAESHPVLNTSWEDYPFHFNPAANYTHLTLEVHYDPLRGWPYNGNLLLDHCSAIRSAAEGINTGGIETIFPGLPRTH